MHTLNFFLRGLILSARFIVLLYYLCKNYNMPPENDKLPIKIALK